MGWIWRRVEGVRGSDAACEVDIVFVSMCMSLCLRWTVVNSDQLEIGKEFLKHVRVPMSVDCVMESGSNAEGRRVAFLLGRTMLLLT